MRTVRHARLYMREKGRTEGSDQDNIPEKRELSPEVKELRSILKKCSIYLVGPMGSGKSAVGKFLAYELGFRFLDMDDLIEAIAKKPISQIFKDDGETAFRDLESAVLEQITPFIACCVATGGGVVLRKENWGKLQTGIVIYLDTPVNVLEDRLLGETEKRPLLKDAESLRDRITDILHERGHLYNQADVTIRCKGGMAIDEISKEIIRTLTNFIKSNPPKLSTLYPGKMPKK